MTEEPYRWLEAISNRREYIEDQLTGGAPVVALSTEAGILLLTSRASTPKIFEIYDHLALGTLGHPADIEKVRQAAIDAAHLEGFARSPGDVSARRLASYNLAPALKNAFEQIFSAPLLFRGILAELGATAQDDALWRLDYDGSFSSQTGPELARGVVISGLRSVGADWTGHQPPIELERGSLKEAAHSALKLFVWAKLRGTKDQGLAFNALPTDLPGLKEKLGGDTLEFGFLDRALLDQTVMYRVPHADELGL